jgi:hypothetical protein
MRGGAGKARTLPIHRFSPSLLGRRIVAIAGRLIGGGSGYPLAPGIGLGDLFRRDWRESRLPAGRIDSRRRAAHSRRGSRRYSVLSLYGSRRRAAHSRCGVRRYSVLSLYGSRRRAAHSRCGARRYSVLSPYGWRRRAAHSRCGARRYSVLSLYSHHVLRGIVPIGFRTPAEQERCKTHCDDAKVHCAAIPINTSHPTTFCPARRGPHNRG